jgi:Fe-S-cluster formation regulator IscX/YfhJ
MLVNPGLGALTDFNDDPETTKEDVLALYDRAIQAVYLASDLKTCYNP